jgi:hypothetical protein
VHRIDSHRHLHARIRGLELDSNRTWLASALSLKRPTTARRSHRGRTAMQSATERGYARNPAPPRANPHGSARPVLTFMVRRGSTVRVRQSAFCRLHGLRFLLSPLTWCSCKRGVNGLGASFSNQVLSRPSLSGVEFLDDVAVGREGHGR